MNQSAATQAVNPSTITYGLNPQNGETEMQVGNETPALAIWLLLVTSRQFLDSVAGSHGVAQLPIQDLVAATHLSAASINQILDQYRNAQETPAVNVNTISDCFYQVATQFQAFAAQVGKYPIQDCPRQGFAAITSLAKNGATITVAATAPRNP